MKRQVNSIAFVRVPIWLTFLWLFNTGSHGQNAELLGTVADETGAIVVGASVRLANLTTDAILTDLTDNSGRYRFEFINPGRYFIEVRVTGFSTHRSDELFVSRGERLKHDITLVVATITEQIVVGVSRQQEFLSQASLPALVIERDTIEETGAQTLEELLVERSGSGVYVSRGFGIGFPQINGVGRNRVLVVVDGQRQIGIDDATRQGIDLDQYTTERIERVEVIKGPNSPPYGSDAMGGVINILTSQPSESFSLNVANSFGSFGERNHSNTVHLGSSEVNGIVTGLYRKFDGYDLDDAGPKTDGFGGGENGFFDRQVSPSLFINSFDDTKVAIRSNYYRRESFFLGDTGERTAEIDQERWNISPAVDLSLGLNNALTVRGDVSVARRFDVDRRESLNQIETLGSVLPWGPYQIRYGFDLRRKSLRRPGLGSETNILVPLGPRGYRSITVVSGWSQHEWRIGRSTKVIAGLRGTHDSAFGGRWTPTVATVFGVTQTNRLRVSFGEGYRAPSVSELFREFVDFGFFTFVGNPFLEPEHSRSVSAGWTHMSRYFRYTLDVFYNRVFDEIGFVMISPDNPPHSFFEELIPLLGEVQLFSNQNLGTFNARGFNSSVTLQLPYGLFGTFDYTLLDRVRVNKDDPERDGQGLIGLGNLRNSAFVQFGWRGHLPMGSSKYDLHASLRGSLRGREALQTTSSFDQPSDPERIGQTEYVPAHQIWDFSLSAVFPLGGNIELQPFLTISNIADFINKGLEYGDGVVVEKPTLPPGPVFREPGRTAKGGVKIQWP